MTSDRVTLISQDPKLPHPRHPPGPDHPFVGNATVEENLTEAVQIAAWTAIGSAKCRIAFDVQGRTVTMRGQLETEQQRQALEHAVAHVTGIIAVVNKVELRSAGPGDAIPASEGLHGHGETVDIKSQPIVYVTRFCSFDEASLSAAIRASVALLDQAFEGQGQPLPRELIVIYRNHRHGTVTLQIGMPAAQFAVAGEFHSAPGPAGPMVTAAVAAGPEAIEHAYEATAQMIAQSGQHAADYYWQRFDEADFRPWVGHPAATILVPLAQTHAA